MKLALIFNRSAGTLLGQDADAMAANAEAALRSAGHEVTLDIVEGSQIVAALEQLAQSDADAIIVGGGDGTIGCAAQILMRKRVALGILPLGTMNLMAKDLKIPLTLDDAVKSLAAGKVTSIDVGDVNGRIFLCSSIIGLFPLLARRRERERGHGAIGWWNTLRATIAAAIRHPSVRLSLRHDSVWRRVRSKAIVIANNAYGGEGIGAAALTRPRLDAGELVLYIASHKTPVQMLKLFARIAMGNWQDDAAIETIALRHVSVHSAHPWLSVMNDGEVTMLKTPLRYRIRPRALNVLVPA